MADLITSLRAASRKLVREWGFLRPTLAGTALSHVAVHCLIEIGDRSPRALSELCTELRVSPDDLKPAVADLLASGNISVAPKPTTESSSEESEGAKQQKEDHYTLTPTGQETLNEVNAYAQNQIAKALQVAHPSFGTDITTALGLYAAALEASRLVEANPTPEHTPIASPARVLPTTPLSIKQEPPAAVRIVSGYIPGLLGRTLEMHAHYYWDLVQWGKEFESDLGAGIADLIKRLDRPMNQAWSVVRTIPSSSQFPRKPAQERIEGVIYVDGECSGEEGVAKIRAFILDEPVRGMGLGKRLVSEAMTFVREKGFRECRLTTMRRLAPAIRLYEGEGFVETGQEWETAWGPNGHMALHFTWRRDQVGRQKETEEQAQISLRAS